MPVQAAIVAAALTGCTVTSREPPSSVTRKLSVGAWRLELLQDRFAGTNSCRLRSGDGRMAVEAGAVAFRFGSRADVAESVYRIDDGAPRRWRDDLPRLVRAGTPLDRGGMAHPTAGAVWIPLSRLADARMVAIRPAADRSVRTFRVGDLPAALETATASGCPSPELFVR